MVLQLARVHLALGVVGRVLVHVRHEDGLRVGRLHMLSRASVAMSACTDLVVEGAINLVLLGTEDGSEVVGHGECSELWASKAESVRNMRKRSHWYRRSDGDGEDKDGPGMVRCFGLFNDAARLKFLESSSG